MTYILALFLLSLAVNPRAGLGLAIFGALYWSAHGA